MPVYYLPYVQKIQEKFAQNYWNFVDQDNSGSLNLDEYKYFTAGFVLIDAKDTIKVRRLNLELCNKFIVQDSMIIAFHISGGCLVEAT